MIQFEFLDPVSILHVFKSWTDLFLTADFFLYIYNKPLSTYSLEDLPLK